MNRQQRVARGALRADFSAHRWTTSLGAVVASMALFACSGSTTATKSDATPSSADGEKASATAAAGDAAPAANAPVTFDDARPRFVTYVGFAGRRLAIGFGDGAVTLVDPTNGSAEQSNASKAFEVAAIGPEGDLVLLRSSPPAIVNFAGDLILQMNTVPSFESAAFNRTGVGVFVADREGKVRIWGQPHSFEKDQHKEKLENYLNRQAPDFHVEFPPVRGPIGLTTEGQVVVADDSGVVRLWDPMRPSSAKQIMKLDGHMRSVAVAEGHVYATSVNGALKIGLLEGGYLPWTKEARGGMAAASPLAPGRFYLLDRGALSARNTEDGEALWQVELPEGHLCGIALADDAATLAACVGNFVAVFDARTGRHLGTAYRDDQFVWRDAE